MPPARPARVVRHMAARAVRRARGGQERAAAPERARVEAVSAELERAAASGRAPAEPGPAAARERGRVGQARLELERAAAPEPERAGSVERGLAAAERA